MTGSEKTTVRLTYRVGDIDIDPAEGYVRRADAGDVYLRQQTLQVLLYLLAHRDRMVGKEELRQAIWGDTAVTDDALVQCVVDIRRTLGDDSRAQRLIKTVPKLGYRFVGPVEMIDAGRPLAPEPARPEPSASEPRRQIVPSAGWLILFTAAVVMAVALAFSTGRWRALKSTAETALPSVPGTRRVVVLYFDNQTGAADVAWLRRGLADMVITDLSRFDGVAVLSRQQLELLLARSGIEPDARVDLEQALRLGREAGAESIVLGSFAAVGEKVRVEAKIHDARTGRLIDAEVAVADRPDQVLTQVDQLALRLANRLGAPTEARGRTSLADVMTNNLEAYRNYVLGLQKSNALESSAAIALFQKAVQLDPDFAMAYARIGYTYAVTQSMPDRAKPYLQKAFELSGRLTEKDRAYIAVWSAISDLDYDEAIDRLKQIIDRYPSEAEAYWRLGIMLLGESRAEEARTVLQRGLAADPQNRDIVNALGTAYYALGQLPDAIAVHRRYVALAPKEPNAYDSLGVSYQYAGSYKEAIDAYRHALALDPRFEVAVIHLGNTYYQLGRYNEALAQFQRYIEVADYDIDRARGYAAMAIVEWKRGNLPVASSRAKRAMELSGRPMLEAVRIALAQGDRATAERLVRQIPDPVSRGSRGSRRLDEFLRGEVALAAGRADEAIGRFRSAVAHPPVPYYMDPLDDCLANGLLRLGRYDNAIAEYRRVLRINPNLAQARFGLAQALDRKGDRVGARTEYERFVQIWSQADPDIPDAMQARQRLKALGAGGPP